MNTVQLTTTVQTPSLIKKDPFVQTNIRRYWLELSDQKIKDIFTLKREEIIEICETLTNKFNEIEKSDLPAQGYQVNIKSYGQGYNPLEVYLDASGIREVNTEMKLPELKEGTPCPFCEKVKKGQIYPLYENVINTNVFVMKSSQHNPLPISSDHYDHFFTAPKEVQADMIIAAGKVLGIAKKLLNAEITNYHLLFNCGVGNFFGHQNVKHLHLHVAANLNGDQVITFEQFSKLIEVALNEKDQSTLITKLGTILNASKEMIEKVIKEQK